MTLSDDDIKRNVKIQRKKEQRGNRKLGKDANKVKKDMKRSKA